MDFVAVMDVFKKDALESFEGYALLKKITRLIELHDDVQISHSYRESNKCTYALVNERCNLNYNFVEYIVAPIFISRLLEDDLLRFYVFRLIPV